MSSLSDAEIEHIADKAAEKAIVKVYEQIGRSVAQRVFWFIGVIFVSGCALLVGTNVLRN
jgi:hypothetical protein